MESDSENTAEQLSSDEESYEIIKDAKQYLEWCKKDKKIKIMDECNPINPLVYLKDISLHKKGPMEDKLYAKHKKYYYNIRRGNTLCQIYDEQRNIIDLFMCRRGMIKFYDLECEYLKTNPKLTYREKRIKKIIFGELNAAIQTGQYRFHLYSLFKENGEHCQIGYIKQLSSWLFASKNVTIVVKTQDDLEHYKKQRFYWAKLIAIEFFNYLSLLTLQKIESLKLDLDGKTMIGQYCGYQKHQHITKYHKIEIIFYAIVDNLGDRHCIAVEEAFAFFDKYGLKKVRTKVIKDLTKHTEINQNIYNLLKSVATGNMNDEGQGAVLYIVAEKDNVCNVVSLCKLKTTEYLIYRKLRQMLKIQLSKKGESANSLSKFINDINQVVANSFAPPRPLPYYIRVAELAFKQVMSKLEVMQESELRYRFVSFLEQVQTSIKFNVQKQTKVEERSIFNRIVLVCLPKTFPDNFEKAVRELGIKIDDVYRQNVQSKDKLTLSIVHMVPRISDTAKNANTYFIVCSYDKFEKQIIIQKLNKQKQPYNQNIISFIKTQDKQKQLDLFLAKIDAFKSLCNEKALNHQILQFNKQLILTKIEQIFKLDHKVIERNYYRYLIVPLLLPGSGKTTLTQFFDKSPLQIKCISADNIRKEVIAQINVNNPNHTYSQQQVFNLSNKQCKVRFQREFERMVSEEVKQDEFIFIDRVFVPNTLDQKINQLMVGRQTNHRLIFVTQESTPWRNNEYQYPFSLTYFLNCFKRSIERQNHETLATDQIQTLQIVVKFYQMFRNIKFHNLEKKYKYSKLIKLPFISEQKDDDKDIRENLKNKFKDCLRCVNPGFDPMESNAFSEFIDTYYTFENQIPVRNPNRQVVANRFLELLQGIIRQN